MPWLDRVKQLFEDKEEISTNEDDEDTGLPFIGKHHLREIWTAVLRNPEEYGISLESDLVRARNQITNSDKHNKLMRVASILVAISWDGWDSFYSTFIEEDSGTVKPGRSDVHLPFLRTFLEEERFLERKFRKDFLATQYRFLPPYIKEGKPIIITKQHRLPFLVETRLSNPHVRDDPGRVTKVRIAAGYYRPRSYEVIAVGPRGSVLLPTLTVSGI